METFLKIFPYIWGPIVGAVIGYFTNYIAVKMLFRPYRPIKIGKCKLPFTPGIIPKRKAALSKAVGDAVGNYLFTGEDLQRVFLAEKTKERMVDVVMQSLDLSLAFEVTEEPLKSTDELACEYLSAEQWSTAKERAVGFLTGRIMYAYREMNVGKMISERGIELLHEKKASLGMLGLLLNENTLGGILPHIGEKVNVYIEEHGPDFVRGVVSRQIDEYAARPIHDLLSLVEEAQIRQVVGVAYEKLIEGISSQLSGLLDISATVEEKVMEMSPRELEALTMRVMKKELTAVVNLGALIGFVLGILNIFI